MQKQRAGRCPCGECRFVLTGEPSSIIACHCTNCQSWTGSACIVSVWVPAAALAITKGQPATNRIGESVTNYYCGSCMRHLFHENSTRPGLRYVPAGLFDDTSWIMPCAHLWTRSAQPWIAIPSDVPAYETQPEDESELLGLWPARLTH
jgi:hypothetical protein